MKKMNYTSYTQADMTGKVSQDSNLGLQDPLSMRFRISAITQPICNLIWAG